MRVKEAILYNCEAKIEMDATSYIPVGNGTEVALLRFLQDADVPVHTLIKKKLGKIKAISPFSPERKRSVVALQCPDRPDMVAVYVKGAPEVVLSLCQTLQTSEGPAEMGEDEREEINQNVNKMAGEPLRVLALAYTEISVTDWEEQFAS
mmetsp:Transcript_34802/g.53450  ORF Transcript_34802/g.53450 Transcript_34802/m.53450 type:complete len:150 (-) Transcript_34802:1544-1993(-)